MIKIETRDSQGRLRLPAESELAECDAADRDRFNEYARAFNVHAAIAAKVTETQAELSILQVKRTEAHALVARLQPSSSAEATKHARIWVETQRRVAAGEL